MNTLYINWAVIRSLSLSIYISVIKKMLEGSIEVEVSRFLLVVNVFIEWWGL